MSFENTNYFTKENLDNYLKELGKEYRRLSGKHVPAELILIGGAAILINYNFRDMTTDVDAVIHAASCMKDASNYVRDKFHLPHDWLNADFTKTSSYSRKLDEFSVHYQQFSNILEVRTISAEYLIAMKLRAGRKYKKDLSDIIGILSEHEKLGIPITMEAINQAVTNLYGGWNDIPADSQRFIHSAMEKGSFEKIYQEVRNKEAASQNLILQFEQKYSGVANEANVGDILKNLNSKAAILEQLKSKNETTK